MCAGARQRSAHLWAHVVQCADAALAALQGGVDGKAKVPKLEAPTGNNTRDMRNTAHSAMHRLVDCMGHG